MKKIIIPLLLLTSVLGYSQQSPLKHMLKTYFRVHPFDMKFTTFILNLQKDPWFTIQEFEKRTDTTFFYLSGTYKNFNPFHYAAEVKLVVAEQQLIHTDTLHTVDTVVVLQLIALKDTSMESRNAAAKEFKRFQNSQAESFFSSNYDKFTKGNTIVGEVENYFVYPLSIAPVTIAWGLSQELDKCAFAITVRFKLKENIANYIAAPWEKLDEPIE